MVNRFGLTGMTFARSRAANVVSVAISRYSDRRSNKTAVRVSETSGVTPSATGTVNRSDETCIPVEDGREGRCDG